MNKMDLRKELKEYYNSSKKQPKIVDVPEWQFLMIDGMDATPESKGFQEAIQTLFSLSYKIKFKYKKAGTIDYRVMPLEGLWWADDMDDFINGKKENWKWTLMIMQPDFVRSEDLDESIESASKKDPSLPYDRIRLEKFKEGLSAQILHIGPFYEEHENIMRVHGLIESENGTFDGQVQKHHEIYLSDFRRTAPEKLRTVIRQSFHKS